MSSLLNENELRAIALHLSHTAPLSPDLQSALGKLQPFLSTRLEESEDQDLDLHPRLVAPLGSRSKPLTIQIPSLEERDCLFQKHAGAPILAGKRR